MGDFILYLWERKNLIMMINLICLVVIVGICHIMPPTHERTVLLRVPPIDKVQQTAEIVELLNSDKENIQWLKISAIRNTNLISLQFKGSDKLSLKEASDRYLAKELAVIQKLYIENVKTSEKNKAIQRIGNKIDLLSLKQTVLTKDDFESLRKEIMDDSDIKITVEYDNNVSDSPIFPPSLLKQIIYGIIIGLFLSLIILSFQYIKHFSYRDYNE